MRSKFREYFESLFVPGLSEHKSSGKFSKSELERIMITRLLFPIHISIFGMSVYEDFDWYKKNRSKQRKRIVKNFIMIGFLLLFVFVGLCYSISVAIKDDELRSIVLPGICYLLVYSFPVCTLIITYQQSENLNKFMTKYMRTCKPLCKQSREFYRKVTLKRNIIFFLCRVNTAIGFIYCYANKCKCFNTDSRFFCGWFFPLWFPIETNYFPVRQLISLTLCMISVRFLLYFIYIPFYTIVFADLYRYKVQCLIDHMKTISMDLHQNIETVRSKLHQIVDYHQELHECFILMEVILSALSLPVLTGFVPAVAAVAVALMQEPNFMDINILVAVICFAYIWCDALQSITDSGENLERAAYEMNWYSADLRIQKDFLIFLMKLQRPMEVKSAFFTLNKAFFIAMLRTLYSFSMVLHRTN